MLSFYPNAIEELMDLLRHLPGVGKRSAERMALAIHQWDDDQVRALANLAASLRERVGTCPECGNLADRVAVADLSSYSSESFPRPNNTPAPSELSTPIPPSSLCRICASPVRDKSVLCVVEETAQLRTIEASGVYRGVYHVLGGRLAPLEGKGLDSIRLPELETRLDSGLVRELILALSPDVEGQATAVYLANRFRARGIQISRPARGLPAGSDLSYADPATIAAALDGRISMKKDQPDE